jgi:hypothetical protein
MGLFYDGYEGSKAENIPTTTFVCGICNIEMMEASRRDSNCPSCGKDGWIVTHQCPECGEKIESFHQNMTHPPFCYCDNP